MLLEKARNIKVNISSDRNINILLLNHFRFHITIIIIIIIIQFKILIYLFAFASLIEMNYDPICNSTWVRNVQQRENVANCIVMYEHG